MSESATAAAHGEARGQATECAEHTILTLCPSGCCLPHRFYRDSAGWCPYCQKVWLLLEQKQIPYRVFKVNMRSYGDKPADYLRKVPSGLLPAIELDGRIVTDSLPIMRLLDDTFPSAPMLPAPGSDESKRLDRLLKLERSLFRTWAALTFQPGLGKVPRFGGTGEREQAFLDDLASVDVELGKQRRSPWFFEGEATLPL